MTATATLQPVLARGTRRRVFARDRFAGLDILFVSLLLLPLVMALVGALHPPFINDNAQLISAARNANAEWRLASSGVRGSFGLPYGPTPTHLYQFLLLLSGSDLRVLIGLRAALFVASIAAGLIWFASELGLGRWLIPVLLVSPTVIIESFQIWDNTLAIPVSILTLACYARFVRRRSTAALVGWILGCLVLLSIHLATVPLVLAIAIDALWNHRTFLWAKRVVIGVTFLLFGCTLRGYALDVADLVVAKTARGWTHTARTADPAENAARQKLPTFEKLSRPAAGLFALRGASILAGSQVEIDPGELTGPLGSLAGKAQSVAWVMVALCGVGIVLASAVWRGGDRVVALALAGRLPARRAVWRIAVMSVALAAIYFAALRVLRGFHYFNGTWIIFAALVWLAVDRIRPRALAAALLLAIAACSLIVDIACLQHLARNAGTRGFYGPDLPQQRQALTAAMKYGPIMYTNVPNLVAYPHALRTLAGMQPEAVASAELPEGLAPVIEYAGQDAHDARLNVRLAPIDSLAKTEYRRINVFRIEGQAY